MTETQQNLPLFYKNPVPLDGNRHGALALKQDMSFAFANEVNAVPINLIEMPQVAQYYPIAFSNDGSATPVAILGLRDKENLMVDEKGTWKKDTYIPSYIRRYPFIFSENPDNDQLILCVDQGSDALVEASANRLFDDEGKPTQLAQNALEFCKNYHAAAKHTQEFSKALAASDLLVDRQASVQVEGHGKITFAGFHVIDEEKLNGLKDKDFLKWRENNWLAFLYAHLFSGNNWQKLATILARRSDKKVA